MLSKVRKALKLRKLYDNWLLTLFQYKVLRKPTITVRCKDGSTVAIDRWLYVDLAFSIEERAINSCINGNLEIYILGGKAHLVPLKEIEHAHLMTHVILEAIEHGWMYSGKYWEKNGAKFVHLYWPIIETFDLEQYGIVSVENKQVVDVGAFVGDSSIYFALKGAERVYAIEPHPLAYEELVQNVSLNGLQGKVVPLNLAISYTEKYVVVPLNLTIVNAAGALFRDVDVKGAKVDARRLIDILEEYNVRPDVLKMDCEGCEYDVILRDRDAVSLFEQVIFEYHAYNVGMPVSRLLEALSKWFSCELVNEQIFARIVPNWDKSKVGAYYCIRKR